MRRLSDPASPYAGPPERLPADPPDPFPCDECGRETYDLVGLEWGEPTHRCAECQEADDERE